MKLRICVATAALLLSGLSAVTSAASKPHVITFGKWTTIKLVGSQDEPLELKVRPLYVDARLREYAAGIPHEITDRIFVVRRVVRVNDALPEETISSIHWTWQAEGWMVVNRETGHISPVSLPEFDTDSSSAIWYRDYVAYCGLSDDGKKLLAVVMQLGRRKPVLRKAIGEADGEARGGSRCSLPTWQRRPPRVTFVTQADQKFTFAVRGHAGETISNDEDDDAGTE
jgi:hypothetical protein